MTYAISCGTWAPRFAPAEFRRTEGQIPLTALDGLSLDLDFMIALRAQEET